MSADAHLDLFTPEVIERWRERVRQGTCPAGVAVMLDAIEDYFSIRERQQRQDEEIERLHQESLDWQQAKSESDSACEDAEEREKQALIVAGNLGARVQQLEEALRRDPGQPWDVDISDYSDEWCAGFLAGQENAQDVFARSLDSGDGAVTDNSGAEIAQSFLDSGDGA